MGLATSQVRLLALTSRKADVEMQIQLNSKRKTMLTRESTELAKLYYAKLQNSKIQYSTTNGNKDVNYGYLMAQDTGAFFDQVVSPQSSSSIDTKVSSSMILTDNYGRVILSDRMLDIVLDTLNDEGQNSTKGARTVETYTIDAMKYLLLDMAGGKETGTSSTASSISEAFNYLYNGTAFKVKPEDANESPSADAFKQGEEVLKFLYENGVKNGGSIWKQNGVYYSNYKCAEADRIVPEKGTFYIARNAKDKTYISTDTTADGAMYWNSGAKEFVPGLTMPAANEMVRMFQYYGAIFSAAFNGTKKIQNDIGQDTTAGHFNVAANIVLNKDGKYEAVANDTYKTVSNSDNLQEGLKSGLYQLVNVSSTKYGGYAKSQSLDYFKTQNYVVEQTDQSERETITAWYNSARADLSEKENYWDSEITQLSAELNTITTEIDSVKKLREDAISSTFKWGSA